MKKFINRYNNYIMRRVPSNDWVVARTIIHLLTLPIKVILLFTWSVFMVILHSTLKVRPLRKGEYDRKQIFLEQYSNLPVFMDTDIAVHTLRVPHTQSPNGLNHNTDHQCARHGVYATIMYKLGINIERVDKALHSHIVHKNLARGYTIKGRGIYEYNMGHTSGDQLLGLLLGAVHYSSEETKTKIIDLAHTVLDTDYALPNPTGGKSDVGMWQPGLEIVGAQAITILALLKTAASFGDTRSKLAYYKLNYLYGYGLLCIAPTSFVPMVDKRGYFNDNNCLTAAYILAKLSTNSFGRAFWTYVATYVWVLSYKWYNSYFTGLLKELIPNLISKKYLESCKNYLYEQPPYTYSVHVSSNKKPKSLPIPHRLRNNGEFLPDEDQLLEREGTPEFKSTLGWVASAVMLDTEETLRFLGRGTQ